MSEKPRWFKLSFTCDFNETVRQYNHLVNKGYTAMMVDKHVLWVSSDDRYADSMLALNTTQCTIDEFEDFAAAVTPIESS